jgi:hypothetical protein
LSLREDEVKYLLRNSGKGYAATFFEREGVWRSGHGYFRLFRDPDGSKGINFGFNYGDLETKETRDSYTNEKRWRFINTGRINFAKLWEALDCAKLGDIIHAIDAYSSKLRKRPPTRLFYTKPIMRRASGVAAASPMSFSLKTRLGSKHRCRAFGKSNATPTRWIPVAWSIHMARISSNVFYRISIPALACLHKRRARTGRATTIPFRGKKLKPSYSRIAHGNGRLRRPIRRAGQPRGSVDRFSRRHRLGTPIPT